MNKVLLIGNGAREHVVAETFKRNSNVELFSYLKSKNPGIISLSDSYFLGSYNDLGKIKDYAQKIMPDIVFVGPEDPLNNGVVDLMQELGIDAIGPTRNLARLETSKSFTRQLMKKYGIDGNPRFEIFTKSNIKNAKKFIDSLEKCVIKPDGLTGGKGVKVQDDHFSTKKEALDYCNEILQTHPSAIVEEKLDGEEFSLQCITDGRTVIATPPVQDHKRAFVDDKGNNTGGMGSYSCEDHLLPFLKKEDVDKGLEITKNVADALHKETSEHYKGVMYAGLIVTKQGVRLIEYNARFGDPEAMNVLPLLENDLFEVCKAIAEQKLDKVNVKFKNKATVCKYVVPLGYPDNPVRNEKIEVAKLPRNARLYYASVDQKEDGLYMSSSRGIALVGIADDLEEAEKTAENAAKSIKGKVFHRQDIGTSKLIQKRVEHMKSIRG